MEKRIFEALGGECEIYGIDITAARLAEGEAWVHEMHDRLTRFSPTSELSRFNASAGSWADVSPLLESLLRESLRAHDLSEGLVNVAVLPALLAAGYTRTFSEGPTRVTASVARTQASASNCRPPSRNVRRSSAKPKPGCTTQSSYAPGSSSIS